VSMALCCGMLRDGGVRLRLCVRCRPVESDWFEGCWDMADSAIRRVAGLKLL